MFYFSLSLDRISEEVYYVRIRSPIEMQNYYGGSTSSQTSRTEHYIRRDRHDRYRI